MKNNNTYNLKYLFILLILFMQCKLSNEHKKIVDLQIRISIFSAIMLPDIPARSWRIILCLISICWRLAIMEWKQWIVLLIWWSLVLKRLQRDPFFAARPVTKVTCKPIFNIFELQGLKRRFGMMNLTYNICRCVQLKIVVAMG